MLTLGLVRVENVTKISVSKHEPEDMYKIKARILTKDVRVFFNISKAFYVPTNGDILIVSGEVKRASNGIIELDNVRYQPVEHLLRADLKGWRTPVKAVRVISIPPVGKPKFHEKIVPLTDNAFADVFEIVGGSEIIPHSVVSSDVEQETDQDA